MTRVAVLLVWLALPLAAGSQTSPPKAAVTAPQTVAVEIGWPGTVEVANPAKSPILILNLFESKLQFRREFTDDPAVMRFFAFGRVTGEFPIVFVTVVDGKPVEAGRTVVTVKGVAPQPIDPVDPPKPPDPKPVDPPKPDNPLKLDGFRVFIIHESGAASSPEQSATVNGAEFRGYLESKCVPAPDGRQKDYFMLDQHVNLDRAYPHWQQVMARPRTALPWIFISNGKDWFEGPLPATKADIMALVRKFGG